MNREFSLTTPRGALHGHLALPATPAQGLVLLAQLHDTALDHLVAANLATRHYAVLSLALLTAQESHFPDSVHNVPLLTQRLVDALDRLRREGDPDLEDLPLGLFASAHVTPAAIRAAARRDMQIRALACHGGLVDLAGLQNLKLLAAPLLMVTDTGDQAAATAFQRAAVHFSAPHALVRLEPGDNPSRHVARWFGDHLQGL